MRTVNKGYKNWKVLYIPAPFAPPVSVPLSSHPFSLPPTIMVDGYMVIVQLVSIKSTSFSVRMLQICTLFYQGKDLHLVELIKV